jgi:hypothetical protein
MKAEYESLNLAGKTAINFAARRDAFMPQQLTSYLEKEGFANPDIVFNGLDRESTTALHV